MNDISDFDLGLEDSVNPRPAEPAASVSGEAVTNGTSWWHTTYCTTCGHTFRRGDRVTVDASTRQVRHLDKTLGCANAAGPHGVVPPRTDVLAFSAGLLAAWPIGGDVPLVRADDIPTLLYPPSHGFRRPSCLFCAHTFRPGEMVVVCPCSPHQRHCAGAVHRDPARGLTCWESWHPDSRIKVCPVLLTRPVE